MPERQSTSSGQCRQRTVAGLCAELDDLRCRQSIIKQQESRGWNAISYHLAYLTSMRWLAGQLSLPAGLSEEEWTAAESRTSAMMSALTGIVLPMLLGLLGACAYVFRDLDRQIWTGTLYREVAWHSALRLMLGGLLSVFWSSATTPRINGIALSLAALAFFLDFGGGGRVPDIRHGDRRGRRQDRQIAAGRYLGACLAACLPCWR